ncbi:MAG: hypothetical protein ABI342_04025 [Nitrososphaera sp.]|jgi:hypothetical protein
MIQKRSRGKKFPTNFVKTAILLLLRNDEPSHTDQINSDTKLAKKHSVYLHGNTKSTTEIINYLNEQFGISEPKGIRVHLGELYAQNILDKETRVGVETRWFWKNNVESFQKLVNFINKNSDMVRDVVEQGPLVKMKEQFSDDIHLVNDFLTSLRPQFDVNKYWFRTSYTRAFLSSNTLEYFVDKAYSKYKKNKFTDSKISKEEFQNKIFETRDMSMIVFLMHYSPSLIMFIINLEDNYKKILESKSITTGTLFLTVINDILIRRLISSNGSTATRFGMNWDLDHKKGLRMNLDCLLSNPQESDIANS